MSERISVHVTTRDRPTEIYGLLSSLLSQTFQEWDLLLLDDCSETPITNHYYIQYILSRIQLDGHGLKVLRNEESKGVAHARNVLVENDEWNELIVRIDDDSILDKDYLQKLHDLATGKTKYKNVKPEEIGAVGGTVPLLNTPLHKRNSKLVKIFNEIKYDTEGNISFSDDGGYSYSPAILLSHHLRSSFLFRKSAWKRVGGYPSHLGRISFTEETWFSLKLLYAGYVLLTDTSAIAWHARAPQGGCRSQDYQQQVQTCLEKFNYYFKRRYLKEGVPFRNEVYR